MSDWLPHMGGCIDDIAVIRSMYTTQKRQPRAQTCSTPAGAAARRRVLDHSGPGSITGWGRSTTNCRSSSRSGTASTGMRKTGIIWDRLTTPSRSALDPANPLDFGKTDGRDHPEEQQIGFDLVGGLNRLKAVEYPDDPALGARIKAYELAYRMQTSVPETLNLDVESKATRELYGLDRSCDPQSSGCRCSPRGDSVERGVRFIQVQHRRRVLRPKGCPRLAGSRRTHEKNFSQRFADKPIRRAAQGPQLLAVTCSIRRSCSSPAEFVTAPPTNRRTPRGRRPRPSHLRFLRSDGGRRDQGRDRPRP